MSKPFLSIAVPTHQFDGNQYYLKRLFNSLWNQSFQDFEIVVTDNSDNDDIQEVCDWYRTGIRYIRNPRKGMAQNTNEAIKQSKGKLIKILYIDDFLAHNKAIQEIVENFKGEWMVSACRHTKDENKYFNTHFPTYSENIHTGNNTIGSPSVLTIKNQDPLLFDEKMTWLLDCDLYKRYYDLYGEPTILRDVNVIIGLHDDQLTNTLSDDTKAQEYEYINLKYA